MGARAASRGGLVFLMHGGQKLFVFGLSGTADFMEQMGAILSGLFTRWAAGLLAIDMAVAILAVKLEGGFFAPRGFEFELTLLGAALTLAAMGARGASADRWLAARRAKRHMGQE